MLDVDNETADGLLEELEGEAFVLMADSEECAGETTVLVIDDECVEYGVLLLETVVYVPPEELVVETVDDLEP